MPTRIRILNVEFKPPSSTIFTTFSLSNPNKMRLLTFCITSLSLSIVKAFSHTGGSDYAGACYDETLPSIPPSTANRTIPWGSPSIKNGSQTCCSSLDEVRDGIDKVDAQLLELLAQRRVHANTSTYRGIKRLPERRMLERQRASRPHMTQ